MMKTTAILAAGVLLLLSVARAEYLVYGFDDEAMDGWYMRINTGAQPPEEPPMFGSNAPAQGAGYVSLGVQSNKYYSLIRPPEGFQTVVAWETYDQIAFDVRLSAPQGWNSFALLCRSDTNWSFSIAASQIFVTQSDQWVTISGPITAALTNYLYSAQWVFFEFVFNQAETNSTRIDIDNFRLQRNSDALLDGLALYDFDTNTLNGWLS